MLKQLRTPLIMTILGALPLAASVQADPAKSQAPAAAQQQAPAAAQQQAPATVSDKKVNNFVAAYTQVNKINRNYSEKLQGVTDAEKATQLQQEAQGKMQKAVRDSGLTIEEYQRIAGLASSDDQLRERIQNAIN